MRKLARALITVLVVVTIAPAALAQGDIGVPHDVGFVQARRIFERARASQPGPERDQLWRDAATQYEAGFSGAPDGDYAPEAAVNAAYAYKQLGDHPRAVSLYVKLIASYGDDAILARLSKSDAKRYAERLNFVQFAYDGLVVARLATFRVPEAAETYAQMAKGARFDEAWRRQAANNAVVLYGTLEDEKKVSELSRLLLALHPTPEERSRLELLLADRAYKKWDPCIADDGENAKARAKAETALLAFYEKYRAMPAARREVAEVAYRIARTKQAQRDPAFRLWFERVSQLAATAMPHDARLAELGAEAQSSLSPPSRHGDMSTRAGLQVVTPAVLFAPPAPVPSL